MTDPAGLGQTCASGGVNRLRNSGTGAQTERGNKGPASTVWDYLVGTPGIAVIHLLRRDLLAAWVSYEQASRSGVWLSKLNGPRPPDNAPFDINERVLARFFARVTASRSWVRGVFGSSP